MSEQITIFKPSILDIKEIINEDKPSFSYRIDNFYYIISLITELKSFRRYDEEDPNPFTPIHSQTLKNYVWNYQEYLSYLVKKRVLEVDNQYIPNEKSRGYRFTLMYSSKLDLEFLTDKKLIHKIKKYEIEKKNKSESQSDYVSKQMEWFQHLTVNVGKAFEKINELSSKQTVNIDLLNKLNLYYVSIIKIQEKRYGFTLDTTSNRFHSNLTNLKKDFRPFLNCDGEELKGIDISNSQPYLTLLLLTKEFYLEEKIGENLNLRDFKGININNESLSRIKNILNTATPLCTGFQKNKNRRTLSQYEEIERYKNSVKNDCFYGDFSKAYKKKTLQDDELERSKIKKIVYAVLFSRNKYNSKKTKMYKNIFKSIYPTVFEILSLIKDVEHNTLAILLQSIESKIVLENAYVRIMNELPDAPLFSIHDSLLTTPNYVTHVRDILEVELTKATGYRPHLKIE